VTVCPCILSISMRVSENDGWVGRSGEIDRSTPIHTQVSQKEKKENEATHYMT